MASASSVTRVSISDAFSAWLSQNISEVVSPENIETIAGKVFAALPMHLQQRTELDWPFSIRLQQAVNFLDMFQKPDEKSFIERVRRLTVHNTLWDALPALHLMVLLTGASVYPPRVGRSVLIQILGAHAHDFFELQHALLVPNLDLVPLTYISKLCDMAQDQVLIQELANWTEGQRLIALLDATSLRDMLDEIPSNFSCYTLEGYKNAVAFLRDKVKNSPRVNAVTELFLDDTTYPKFFAEGLPKEIMSFHNLKKLVINSRNIFTLPPSLVRCQELREIQFFCSASNDYLPQELSYLPKLQKLVTWDHVLMPLQITTRADRHYSVITLPKG